MNHIYNVILVVIILGNIIVEAIYRRDKSSNQNFCASPLCWTAVEFCKRFAVWALWWGIYTFGVLDFVFKIYDREGQAAYGDTKYEWGRTSYALVYKYFTYL